MRMGDKMKFYDAFGGIGGFRLGLERTGYECVGYCDNDRHAVACYNKRFDEKHEATDIRKLDAGKLPNFDLLVGGFPCQPFSLAGKRKGTNETRGTLFAELIRIARAKRPRHLLFENVKGLLSANGGRDFAIILNAISRLGYRVEWQVLNSKHFGVPQNRERVFIHSFRGESGREIFPLQQSLRWADKNVKPKEISRTVTARFSKRIGNTESRVVDVLVNADSKERFNSLAEVCAVLTPNREEKRQNGRRMKGNGEPSFTLTGRDKHGVFDGKKVRLWTPRECERLQGFPDDWTLKAWSEKRGDYEQSDSQRYKQLGNAVTVNVIQALGEALKEIETTKT